MPDDSIFRFKRFCVSNHASALKVGTDAVLLGAAMTLRPEDTRLLDIGTGTGVIALMAAQRLSDLQQDGQLHAYIEAIDIDAPSAEEAAHNFTASPWAPTLEAHCISLDDFTPAGKYELIFSNPPYYDNSLVNPDARESTARHTASLSYRDICAFAAQWLSPDGRLSLILPYDAATALRRTAASFGLHPFRTISVRTTSKKAPRRIIAEFSRKRTKNIEETLTLQEGPARTAEYTELTGDFYL